MTLLFASLVFGIVPMVVYALVVWRLDRWEKEPFPLLLAAFLWGSIPSIVLAIIAQGILGLPVADIPEEASLLVQLYQASLVAPVTEELVKGAGLVLLFVMFRREIDSVLDGLIYGSMIGFGFSAVENVFYFLGQTDPAGLFLLFFLRAFVFGMLHALFTGLTGVGLALGKFSHRPAMKVFWPVLGLSLAIFTHSLHNYFATLGGEHLLYAVAGISLGMVWFATLVIVCLHHENRWIRLHLSEEVDAGILYAQQALDAAHFWTRSSLSMLTRGPGIVLRRRKLLHQATELAFEKQRHAHFGASPDCERRLGSLREEVRRLSREDPLVRTGLIRPESPLPPPLPPLRRPHRPPPPLPGSTGSG